MDASVVDLRYKMRHVIKALDRREKVRILYHGKVKGEILPCKPDRSLKTAQHPLYGMRKSETADPVVVVAEMRRRRNHAL